MNKDKLIPVGSLVKHHGLRGELKVFLYNEDSETLVKGLSILIETDNDFIYYDLENVFVCIHLNTCLCVYIHVIHVKTM